MPDEAAPAPPQGLLKTDLLRAGAILLVSSLLGLATNALSRHPVPLLDPQGPGFRAPRAPTITIEDLGRGLSDGTVVLLDARSESECRLMRPVNAWRVTLDGFPDEYAQVKPFLSDGESPAVLCDTDACPTGNLIVEWLRRLGHADARIVAGGWEAYRKGGLPVEGARASRPPSPDGVPPSCGRDSRGPEETTR